MSSRERYDHRKKAFGLMLLFALGAMGSPALAIDVELTLEQAKQIMASARGPMEQAASNDEMFAIIKAADKNSRIGEPSPQRVTVSLASDIFRIIAGSTWLVSRSKLSPGPYRLVGIALM